MARGLPAEDTLGPQGGVNNSAKGRPAPTSSVQSTPVRTNKTRVTVLGASGFIGGHLAKHFRALGYECLTPGRNEPSLYETDLGDVIYAIGLTADFRQRPLDTIEAHV